GGLLTGQESSSRTLALGVSGGVPQLSLKVYAAAAPAGPALAFVRTLDQIGQPLPSISVAQSGPAGQGSVVTDPQFGVTTLGMGAGNNSFAFSSDGYLPVWRRETLVAGSVFEVPSPRLSKRSTNSIAVSASGSVLTNAIGNFQITVPAGAFAVDGAATLTPLTAQTLPALLPTGWSPLQAFWLELPGEPTVPLPGHFDLWGPINRNETAALVRWNTSALRWDVVSLVTGLGAAVVDVQLSGPGAWAIVVGDPGLTVPQPGQPLPAATVSTPDYSQFVVGSTVTPSTSSPSKQPELVTATASLVISNTAHSLASGILLRAKVTETYQMRDGSIRKTPTYETWFVGYQRPGDTNTSTLHASFPLRPLLLLGGDELQLGVVNVDILPPTSFAGAVFAANGGNASRGGVNLSVAPGVLSQAQAVQLADISITNFSSLADSSITLIGAFQLTVGDLGAGAQLGLQITNASANSQFVLARVISQSGVYGLQPIARLTSDSAGQLHSAEPASNPRLPGLNGSGQFVLVRVQDSQALVTGVARDRQNNAVAGLVVRLGPWLTITEAGGSYRLVSSAGSSTLGVLDPVTGNTASTVVVVPANQPVVNVVDQITGSVGPQVVSLSPANGSTNVPLVASVVVTFSKPVNPATVVGDALQIIGPDSNAVPVSFSLNLRGDQASILPVNPLQPLSTYSLVLSTNIADLGGLTLVGPNRSSFSTADQPFTRDPGAQLITYEPTNGVMQMRGTAGFSQPSQPVILVNETSGRTTTVLANADGSFSGGLAAAAEDQVSVTVVNGNGSRDRMAPNRQIYADGGVGLFSGGGTLEAQGPYGQVQLLVEAGSIAGKAKFNVEALSTNQLPTNVIQTPLVTGPVYGGIRVKAEGNVPDRELHVSFPIPVEKLGLPPGMDPTNVTFGLVVPREFTDEAGQKQIAYELIDRMLYEDGKLVTHSPPFL
ncbi:MAG TPA: Ig-like domain-containing protein, partial [Clostridia bacterium]|nr:Ig-like domain-containing protein [Clostridia bacterium]